MTADMKHHVNSIIPFIAALILASLPSQADAGAPAQWYQNLTIKYLYAGQVGDRVAVRFHQTISMGDCYNGQEVTIDSSNPHFKSILAMLMTAYATRSLINIYTNAACASYGVLGTDVSLGEM